MDDRNYSSGNGELGGKCMLIGSGWWSFLIGENQKAVIMLRHKYVTIILNHQNFFFSYAIIIGRLSGVNNTYGNIFLFLIYNKLSKTNGL